MSLLKSDSSAIISLYFSPPGAVEDVVLEVVQSLRKR
ncbi:hypothetical protein FB556_1221 [Enteractinococcus coprophilus]|uniref:Uncharacterized protein n=1 Tax=Enteractinococcus coprophilus TaxID=1027633 RepID=A0A543AJ32_9MICC|nr:hypothetical protein FB556_1221 [Enteractinococcus coprophilus]